MAKGNGGVVDEVAARVKAPPRPRDPVVIALGALRLREHANDDWVVVAPVGVTVEDLEDPQLWTGAAQRLKPYDVVRVIASDESYFAECLVRDAMPGKAIMKVLNVVELGDKITDDSPDLPKGHRVYRGNSAEGWIVERTNQDGSITIMAKGCDNGWWNKRQAMDWLLNHASVREAR
jgi:hypothetical protein